MLNPSESSRRTSTWRAPGRFFSRATMSARSGFTRSRSSIEIQWRGSFTISRSSVAEMETPVNLVDRRDGCPRDILFVGGLEYEPALELEVNLTGTRHDPAPKLRTVEIGRGHL